MDSKKRKPLSDITNAYNLIPTSTLRELVAASSRSNLRSKPPISIFKSGSSSPNQRLCSESSNRSDASIGSSNVNSARNSRTVQFRKPPHLISSTSNIGGSRDNDVANNRNQNNGNEKKDGETPLEKRIDEGKAIAEPFSSSVPVEKRKDKGKAIDVPFSLSPHESEVDVQTSSPSPVEKRIKGKATDVPFGLSEHENGADVLVLSPTPFEKRKDKGKGIAVPFGLLAPESEADVLIFGPEKSKGKGKAIDVPVSSPRYQSETDVQTSSPTSVKKRKDKGKAIAVQFSSLAPVSEADVLFLDPRKDKGKAINVPFSSSSYQSEANIQTSSPSPVKKRKDNEADVLVSSRSPVEKMKDNGGLEHSGKEILSTYGRSHKKAEKGKAVVNSSISAIGEQEVIEKGITNPSSYSNEKIKEGIARHSVSSISKRKESGTEFVIPPIEKAKENGKHLRLFTSLLKKTKDKGKAIVQPSNTLEIGKHNESSGSLTVGRQPPRRKGDNRKSDAVASSAPPIRRTKNLWNELDDVGDLKSSNSRIDPRPKSRKKRRTKSEITGQLPADFIEQQKAYFKEVDEFELPEEEVSHDESD